MRENKTFFRASCENFKKIPGSRIAYWVGEKTLAAFYVYGLKLNNATSVMAACQMRSPRAGLKNGIRTIKAAVLENGMATMSL